MEKWIEAGKIEATDLGRIYELLSAPLPQEGAKQAYTQGMKGYNTTGYSPQFFINRMNEVCGLGGWRIRVADKSLEKVPFGTNKEGWEAVLTVESEIGNFDLGKDPAYFRCLAMRISFGGHTSRTKDDALKSALSDAIKKGLSGFGVGKLAYEGGLDDALRDGESVPAGPPPPEPPSQYKKKEHEGPPPESARKEAQQIRDLTETEKKVMGVDDLKTAQAKFAALTPDDSGKKAFLAGLGKFQAKDIDDVYVSAIGTVRKVLLKDYAALEKRVKELETEGEAKV